MGYNSDMTGPCQKTVEGVDVYLDSYYVHDTYSGVIMGAPGADTMIDSAKAVLKSMWGDDRPLLVVPPVRKPVLKPDGTPRTCIWPDDHRGTPMESLPGRVMMCWLNSYTAPPGEDFCGSHLFVLWFDDEDAQSPLLMALKHVNDAGGWWANAKGWDI